MPSKRPRVIVTRRLPDVIETRMMELFDAKLNHDDTPMGRDALVEAMHAIKDEFEAYGWRHLSGRYRASRYLSAKEAAPQTPLSLLQAGARSGPGGWLRRRPEVSLRGDPQAPHPAPHP